MKNIQFASMAEARRAKFGGTKVCKVFALCRNEATTTVPNPILGPVQSCQRCADKIERLGR